MFCAGINHLRGSEKLLCYSHRS